ncbi:MAG: hypothetical protein VW907_06345 [Opitutae bacterium]|jgi:hypothetical protein
MALNYTVTAHGKPRAVHEGRAPAIGTVIASGDIRTTNADSGLLFGLLPQKAGQSYQLPDGTTYRKRTVDGQERWVNTRDQGDWFSLEANEEKKADTGGGGSGEVAQKSAPAGIMNVGTPGGTVIPGTYEGGSGGSVGLLQISPGAVNWKPQVGVLNPLADPNNFYANLPPIQMPQDQRYIDYSLLS